MPTEILDKQVGIDIDGDKKPDIKLDIKTIAIVVGFIISGSMGYQTLKQEIELAKELPEPEVSRMEYDLKDQMIRDSILNTEEKVDKLEEKVDSVKDDTRMIQETLLDMNKD